VPDSALPLTRLHIDLPGARKPFQDRRAGESHRRKFFREDVAGFRIGIGRFRVGIGRFSIALGGSSG